MGALIFVAQSTTKINLTKEKEKRGKNYEKYFYEEFFIDNRKCYVFM